MLIEVQQFRPSLSYYKKVVFWSIDKKQSDIAILNNGYWPIWEISAFAVEIATPTAASHQPMGHLRVQTRIKNVSLKSPKTYICMWK